MSSRPRVADFICAGAQKSGTSWLFEQLRHHPQVFMATKELNFFYRDLPPSWYAEQFLGAAPHQQCGDISPNYAAFSGLAERIHQICPDARLLHVLRDPVARAFSQWKMATHLGNIPRGTPFIEAFRQNLQYMRRRGEYASILEEYVARYPLGERLQVYWFDDIRTRPAALIREILAFLTLDTDWTPPHLLAVVGASVEDADLNADDAAEVAAYYAPHDRRLRALLDVDSLPW